MYKKVLLKITLLLSNASMYATNAKQVLGSVTHGARIVLRHYSHVSKARLQQFLKAIKNQEVEVAKRLLEQNHSFLYTEFDGHSLAYTAISTQNQDLIELVHRYGARLFQEEQKQCQVWEKFYPDLFTVDPNFAPYQTL